MENVDLPLDLRSHEYNKESNQTTINKGTHNIINSQLIKFRQSENCDPLDKLWSIDSLSLRSGWAISPLNNWSSIPPHLPHADSLVLLNTYSTKT